MNVSYRAEIYIKKNVIRFEIFPAFFLRRALLEVIFFFIAWKEEEGPIRTEIIYRYSASGCKKLLLTWKCRPRFFTTLCKIYFAFIK